MTLPWGSSVRSPELAEVIRLAMESRLIDVHCCMPVVVTAYDASKQKVTVKPLVKNAYLDEEEKRQVESFPAIAGVPVLVGGAGGFRTTYPISDGNLQIDGQTIPATIGDLRFTDQSMDKWLSGDGGEVDPEIDHWHALSDGIFTPGLHTFGNPWSSMPTDHMTIGADAGVQIHLRGQTICIGDESGASFIALAQKVDDLLTALRAAITAAKSAVVAQDGGLAAFTALDTALKPPALTYSWPTSVAASQGKAK